MSTEKSEKSEVTLTPAVEPPATTYHEAAQAFLDDLRRMREKIPHFVMPTAHVDRKTVASAASVSAEFIELAAAARANHPALARGEETTPAESRDLIAFADAFAPVADAFAAMAQYVRFSTEAARSKAGYEALTTYALARRLASRPEHAGMAAHVAGLRRALGNRGKRKATNKPEPPADPSSSEEK